MEGRPAMPRHAGPISHNCLYMCLNCGPIFLLGGLIVDTNQLFLLATNTDGASLFTNLFSGDGYNDQGKYHY